MKFSALARLGELRARLAPVLNELGMTATFGRPNEAARYAELEELKYQVICFRRKDGKGYSSFEVELGRNSGPDASELSWKAAGTAQYCWEMIDIGSNGWAFFRPLSRIIREDLPESLDDVFVQIEAGIRDADIVWPDIKEGVTEDFEFASAYSDLRKNVDLYDIGSVTCSRDDHGIESYNFVDCQDRNWRVAFEEFEVVLYIDNERRDSKKPSQQGAVGDFILHWLFETSPDCCLD